LSGEGVSAVERCGDGLQAKIPTGCQPSLVLRQNQLPHGRAAITRDVRRIAPDDVEQFAVQEQESVDAAGHLRLHEYGRGSA
jgi:hypothetical protein